MTRDEQAPVDGPLSVVVTTELGAARVALIGELDLATADELGNVVDSVLALHPGMVLLDLTQLGFCDASGLRGLLELHQRLVAAGVQWSLSGLSPMLSRLLSLTHLEDVLVPAPQPPQH